MARINLNNNPFPGAAEPKNKKSVKKAIKRDGIVCTCGAIKEVWTTVSYLHDKDCIINTKKRG